MLWHSSRRLFDARLRFLQAQCQLARLVWFVLNACCMKGARFTWLTLPLALAACGSSSGSDGGNAGSAGSAPTLTEVELGVPGGKDDLDFAPFADGAELRLETFGQGGTHVLLAVRTLGFGSRAFVSLRVKNSNSGTELLAPAPVRPQLLYCEGETCDLVPITVMMGGITQSDAERDGLPIEITAEVHNQAGSSGECTRSARLSTADL